MSEEMVIEADVSPEDAELARKLASEPDEPQASENTEKLEQPADEPKAENPEVEPEGDTKKDVDETLRFKVKGEEKEYTKEQLQHLLSRDETFQQKFNKLNNSDEYKLGLLLSAAKNGDKGAQKQLMAQMKEVVEDFDALDDVEEDFDVEKTKLTREQQEQFEEVFADVKGEVDYEENLAKIKTDLKSKLPEKVWQSYWDTPETRRTMYDLIKSGRTEEIFVALDEELGRMPLGERVKIKNDPELYGSAVIEVIRDLNARGNRAETKDPVADDLDAVSTGRSSHSNPRESETIDWEQLLLTDPDKFKEMERKVLGRNL